MEQAYRKTGAEVAAELQTEMVAGLSADEAQTRLNQIGLNKLEEKGGKSPLAMILGQLKETMVIILFIAALISFSLHEVVDGLVILVIVAINTVIGFWQEFKAEKAMEALKKLTVPEVRVRRAGQERRISSHELVPGDVMIIEAGNVIPADGRLTQASNLKVKESALTGESEPVEKHVNPIDGDNVALGDRRNMVYMGTIVTYGRGEVLVTGTGMQTELGHIADMLQSVEDETTPLQKRLSKLGRLLALSAICLIVIVSIISLARGYQWKETFMTAISMAVAAIPEGLPAVVTIALALGAKKLLEKQSLIRHLPAVETLGSVTYICSDKTGTLTQNRMSVIRLVMPDKTVETEDLDRRLVAGEQKLMLMAGALCNDAVLEKKEDGGIAMIGDPTEGALVAAAEQFDHPKQVLEQHLPRIDELPFDSERKRMTTVHTLNQDAAEDIRQVLNLIGVQPDTHVAFTKGSIDGMMEHTHRILRRDGVHTITDPERKDILAKNAEMAQNGIRVLGVAARIFGNDIQDRNYEHDLVYLGMTGMIDPVRPEARDAVLECKQAGIHPVMITGDHPLTAMAIARDLGLAETGDKAVTGAQLSAMSVQDLEKDVFATSVYARVSPEHKMKIIDALQVKGQIVAMTGDGVNDAPALKSADIGVAMGITGTDVSKEASDMILVDDNFATIVNAVKEGRKIYDNIRKFLKYILAGNLGEILVMLFGPLMGLPIPLLPIQILWINLVTDGLPAIALGYEPAEPDIMKRPPYPPNENIFARGVGIQIGWIGTLTAVICLVIGLSYFPAAETGHAGSAAAGIHTQSQTPMPWQTMIFTTLTFCQMGFALAVRSNKRSIFTSNPMTNIKLFVAVSITMLLQLVLLYWEPARAVFKTVALSAGQLGVCLLGTILVILAVEADKLRSRNACA